jgi:hypothetical protein
MKILRFLLILILILIVAVLVLGLVEPKDITVTRSATINAPRAIVWDQIVKFKNWNNWSPWYQKEPGQIKMSYFGNDGEPGSGYHWVGSSKTGEGEMTNKGVSDGHMDFQLHFIKPMNGMADGSFDAKDTAGMTNVTWTMTNHMKYPWNAMCVFFNAEKMIGGDFEKGLANMKQYSETHASAPAAAAIEIKETEYPGHAYAMVHKDHPISTNPDSLMKFFGDSYALLNKAAAKRIDGPPAAIVYYWDDTNKHQADIAPAMPISGNWKENIPGVPVMYSLNPHKAYMGVHHGSYATLKSSHMAMKNMLASKNQKLGLIVEEYPVGPGQEKDSTKWVTNIWYLIQ